MSDNLSNKFRLRPMEKADLEVISHWFQDPEDVALFDRTSRVPLNQFQTEESWKAVFTAEGVGCKCWFVVENSSGEAVGLAGIESVSLVNRDAVVAMFVDKSARRIGVGIRATALVVDFAFRQLGLNRLTSYYRADNTSSRDLVARIGCQVEGTMREAWFADGQFHDMVVVGVLKGDWAKRRDALAAELSDDTQVSLGPNASAAWTWPPKCKSG